MGILSQLVMNALIAGAAYAILALGFNVVYGLTKFLNVAYGVVATVGAYGVFFFSRANGLPLWLGIILGIFAAGLASYLTDLLVFKPLRRRKASGMVQTIASLGLMLLIESLLAIFFTSQLHNLADTETLPRVFNVGGTSITSVQILTIAVAIILFAGLILLLKKTAFGRAVRAISDDEEVAKMIGINTERIISIVFFLGGAVAGVAGILVGFDVGIFPTMGFFFLIEAATASIIGGIGNVYGGVIGAFLYAFAENLGVWKIDAAWKPAIGLGLLVLFLIFRPQGILPGVSKK